MALDDFDWDAYLKGMGADQTPSPAASQAGPTPMAENDIDKYLNQINAKKEREFQDYTGQPPDVTRPNVPLQAASQPNIPDKVPGVPATIKLPPPPKADTTDTGLESWKQQMAGTPPPPGGAEMAGEGVGAAVQLALLF